jgi:hypothetical protein
MTLRRDLVGTVRALDTIEDVGSLARLMVYPPPSALAERSGS